MSDMTIDDVLNALASKAVKEEQNQEKKMINDLNAAMEKVVAAPTIPEPTKISDEEADNLPDFSDYVEVAKFFKQRYGDRFIIDTVSIRIDNEKSDTYYCDLILDPETYHSLKELVYGDLEDRNLFPEIDVDEEFAFYDSFQRIEIYSNGNYLVL